MDKPEQIAARLTAAGREALSWFKPHTLIGWRRRGYPEIRSLGLVSDVDGKGWAFITELGKQVRAILQAQENTNATGR